MLIQKVPKHDKLHIYFNLWNIHPFSQKNFSFLNCRGSHPVILKACKTVNFSFFKLQNEPEKFNLTITGEGM